MGKEEIVLKNYYYSLTHLGIDVKHEREYGQNNRKGKALKRLYRDITAIRDQLKKEIED